MSALALALMACALAGQAGEADRRVLAFGGDVALGRVVAGAIAPIGGDSPLAEASPILAAADLAIVNLEGVLWDGALATDGIRLVAPTARAEVLRAVGIDLVSLANNHALDAGTDGLAATERALAATGIGAVGAGERVIVRALDGLSVAFVALTDRRNATTRARDLDAIAYAPSAGLAAAARTAIARAQGADVIVALVHWGRELSPGPTREQREAARAMIDAGARLVVGHGPHLVHEVERYRDGAILYSLGNLVFDMRDPRTLERVVARVTLGAGGVIEGIEIVSVRE